jgi:hypothetical protein
MDEWYFTEWEPVEIVPRAVRRKEPEEGREGSFGLPDHPGVRRFLEVILEAMEPFLEARLAVVQAVKRWGQGPEYGVA